MSYLVLESIPYEGWQEYEYETLEDIKTAIKSSWGSSWDDFRIYEIKQHIDIYELMKED